MGGRVLVLGANGRLGRAVVDAFVSAGWTVLGQVRRDPPEGAPSSVQWVRIPISDPGELATAVDAADVVVHAVNPPYPAWQTEAVPLLRSGIETASRLRALFMFPGNVYNFGASMPELLLETTPAQPTARKGVIRVEMEKLLREAAGAGLRVTTIRAGDFFGGAGRGSWFDLVIAKSLGKGRVVYPGPTNVVHAWAYLPDLAEVVVRVAAQRAHLPQIETLHFPGHTLTGEQLIQAMTRAARRLGVLLPNAQLRRGTLPWPLLQMAGLFVPRLRELPEMRYLWEVPHRLSGERLAKLIGTLPQTPLDQAMDAAVRALGVEARVTRVTA